MLPSRGITYILQLSCLGSCVLRKYLLLRKQLVWHVIKVRYAKRGALGKLIERF